MEQNIKKENTEEFFAAINQEAENVAPEIDISNCDTFTQIVDQRLEEGMGWTNENFGDTNVLLV